MLCGDLSLDFYQDIYNDGVWCLEAYSSSASKGAAAKLLQTITKAERLVAFGDSLNDLSLFAACDEAYAVENAHPQVKAAATGIIGKHYEDGVTRYLDRLLNLNRALF